MRSWLFFDSVVYMYKICLPCRMYLCVDSHIYLYASIDTTFQQGSLPQGLLTKLVTPSSRRARPAFRALMDFFSLPCFVCSPSPGCMQWVMKSKMKDVPGFLNMLVQKTDKERILTSSSLKLPSCCSVFQMCNATSLF